MLGPTLTGSTVVLAPLMPEHLDHYLLWFADPSRTSRSFCFGSRKRYG